MRSFTFSNYIYLFRLIALLPNGKTEILAHKQVMLLGHSDSYVRDKSMQVTIAYNHFGEGLIQRMPR